MEREREGWRDSAIGRNRPRVRARVSVSAFKNYTLPLMGFPPLYRARYFGISLSFFPQNVPAILGLCPIDRFVRFPAAGGQGGKRKRARSVHFAMKTIRARACGHRHGDISDKSYGSARPIPRRKPIRANRMVGGYLLKIHRVRRLFLSVVEKGKDGIGSSRVGNVGIKLSRGP